MFAHACKMGLEGIVSKRKTSPYRSGRSLDWIKSKNPACEAVRREEEEDWGRRSRVRPDALGGFNNAILAPVTLPAGGTR